MLNLAHKSIPEVEQLVRVNLSFNMIAPLHETDGFFHYSVGFFASYFSQPYQSENSGLNAGKNAFDPFPFLGTVFPEFFQEIKSPEHFRELDRRLNRLL